MVFSTTTSNFFPLLSYAFVDLNLAFIPSPASVVSPGKKRFQQRHSGDLSLDFVEDKRIGFFGFGYSRGMYRCKSWEGEREWKMEAELLHFMKKSGKAEAYPSKKELVDAGRMDLAEAIAKKGGWMSLLGDSDSGEEDVVSKSERCGKDCDSAIGRCGPRTSRLARRNVLGVGVNSCESTFPQAVSLSGRSSDVEGENHFGIEGILNRLETERNKKYGIGLQKEGVGTRIASGDDGDELFQGSSKYPTVAGHERSVTASFDHYRCTLNDSGSESTKTESSSELYSSKSLLKPVTWRSWSIQRADLSCTEFEPAEIFFKGGGKNNAMDTSKDEIRAVRENAFKPSERREFNSGGKGINHKDIRTRLRVSELELASAVRALRSRTGELVRQEGDESACDRLWKLCDAWEFRESEIMKARDTLQSIRSKIAIAEGKMALALSNAQKVDIKQKRIVGARMEALRLLRSVCVVWPNLAAEVFLAGSFDGWTTQRKMKRSSTGIFSVSLMLYPGRYEIKFIVDGEWKTDPLRPVVRNNGHQNNLLIIT